MKKVFLLLFSIIIFSCTEEEVLLQSELNAQQIQKVITENDVKNISLFYRRESDGDTFWFQEERQETAFAIAGTDIVVDNKYFSLANLYKYYVEGDTLFIYLQ